MALVELRRANLVEIVFQFEQIFDLELANDDLVAVLFGRIKVFDKIF